MRVGEFVVMESLKILAIGNSFSEDCMEYVYQIAESLGVQKIKLGVLYIGGCPLALHCQNAREDKGAYLYHVNDNGVWHSIPDCKMKDAILEEEWDFIFTQQYSGDSGRAQTYDDYEELERYVKGFAKNAVYGWQMTWAYPEDSDHYDFVKYDNDQAKMYDCIVNAVKEKILPKGLTIIPTGTAVQNARKSLSKYLNRDNCHLSFELGRYLAGLCVVGAFTKLPIEKVTYTPNGVDDKQKQTVIAAVKAAFANPFEVTL